MKKRILLVFVLFLSLFIMSACTTTSVKSGAAFAQLKEAAYDVEEISGSSYRLNGRMLGATTRTFAINCLGTNLAYQIDDATGNYRLINFATNATICEVMTNTHLSTGMYGTLARVGRAYYHNVLPIVVYEENDSVMKIVDPYGTLIHSEVLEADNVITSYHSFDIKDDLYFYLVFSNSDNIYLKAHYENNHYTVEKINEVIYREMEDARNDQSDDGLMPLYDRKGKVYGYIYWDTETIFIYNSKKQFLNNVNPEAFGIDIDNMIFLEKKLVFYTNDVYVKKNLDAGSKQTYKCRCLTVDLKNGKVSYNDNFKYYILNAEEMIYEGDEEDEYTYKCCKVIFQKLNKRGEREDVNRCVILTNKLSFRNSFIYDGFEDVFMLNKKTLLAYYSHDAFLITKKGKTLLYDCDWLQIAPNGLAVYSINNEYYSCQPSELAKTYRDSKNGAYYISSDTYNGSLLTITYDKQNNEYKAGSYTLLNGYVDYAKKGIYVTADQIYVGSQSILSYSTKTISEITTFATFGESIAYQVRFEDSSYAYFIVETQLEK